MDDIVKKDKNDLDASRAIVLKEIGEESRRRSGPAKPLPDNREKIDQGKSGLRLDGVRQIDLLKALGQVLPAEKYPDKKPDSPAKPLLKPEAPLTPIPPVLPAVSTSYVRGKIKANKNSSSGSEGNAEKNRPAAGRPDRALKLAKTRQVPIRIVPGRDGDVFFQGVFLGLKALAAGTIFAVLSYAALYFSVILFEYDAPVLRKISKYAPFPALVCDYGLVDYFDYSDFVSSRQARSQDPVKELASVLLAGQLLKKYGLAADGFSDEINWNLLNKKILTDEKINNSALARINKIKELAGEDNFSQVSEQFGEKFEQITLSEIDAIRQFGQEIASLEVGQVSDVIVASNGFYIVKLIDRGQKAYSLMSVFVEAENLEDYINRKLSEDKYWLLVSAGKKEDF